MQYNLTKIRADKITIIWEKHNLFNFCFEQTHSLQPIDDIHVSELSFTGFKTTWPCWPLRSPPVHSQSAHYNVEQLPVRCPRVSDDLDTGGENKAMKTLQSSWTAQRWGASANHHLFAKVKCSLHTSPTAFSKCCLELLLMGQSLSSLHCMLGPSVTRRSHENREFSPFWHLGWPSWTTEVSSSRTLCHVSSTGQHFSLADPRCTCEVRETQAIARLRVHMERLIRCVKEHTFFDRNSTPAIWQH